MLKVALMPEFFAWAGGIEFLRNIAIGLHSIDKRKGIVVVVAINRKFRDSGMFGVFVDYFKEICTEESFIYYESVSEDFSVKLQAAGVNIVFPVNGDLGVNFPLPWTAYIADYQHKYMHHLFTEYECFYRETAFAARLRDSKVVVVNADAVKNDIIKFYPWVNVGRVFALPFAPMPLESWIQLDGKSALYKYNISGDYLMICNQFWIHKDHPTAFKAFASVSNKNIKLICTGTMEDYRSPEYIQQLRSLLETLEIQERVIFLGHIPKEDQIGLLKNAKALIQPTLFEGGPGGGACYDAIALGLPVLLSDIPINTEIESNLVHFFPVGDSAELARLMHRILEINECRPSTAELFKQMLSNREKLGNSLYNIISETLLSYAQ